MTTREEPRDGSTMGWLQVTALVVGVVLALTGAAGLVVNAFDEVPGMSGTTVRGLTGNPLLDLANLAIGVLGLALSSTLYGARCYGWTLAIGYGTAFVYGLFAVGESWDLLALDRADNALHLLAALVGLVIARGPVRSTARRHVAHG
ncbi:DUF4383 domain-containing protein [Modestobacter sp. VKM Ac-2979]|uniref:DUF4383 domain-containing protein n=1 Tax=unclassified Modestobacter TaxID=2643866 RepID=UPI0022AB5F98|nr:MULTISPECIES: DUF4383 domain-containing protein [unclassified Modestobacter]MCZ2812047.1 DUF4383 domain-containing protein [Modestobacter sp. VKM Ac-2979]MCZ2843771.1 DUF4383 domain-containing protein [Modestobacter sp. VKM Ac-2980]